MSTTYNDNNQLNAPKAIENKSGVFQAGVWRPYNDIDEVYSKLFNLDDTPKFTHRNLLVFILIEGEDVPYWFKGGNLKEHLVPLSLGTNVVVVSESEENGTDAISSGWAFTLEGLIADINSRFNESGEPLFTFSQLVSLGGGKTVGKYGNGQTMSFDEKTLPFIMSDISQEGLEPTLTLTSSTTIAFNQTAIDNILNFTKTINSVGATVATAVVEWRRNNTGSWTTLTSNTAAVTFTHSLTDGAFSGSSNGIGNDTQPFNYRYTVTDTAGGTKQVLLNITPAIYVAPTKTISAGSTTRERGNVESSVTSTATRQSSLVPIQTLTLQYSLNNTDWFTLDGPTDVGTSGGALDEVHNDSALVDTNNIYYRLKVIDSFVTSYSSTITINFIYASGLGYRTTAPSTIAHIESDLASNKTLTDSRARTINGVTATDGKKVYYWYRAGAGDLTSIFNGPELVTSAFHKLVAGDITGLNAFGATVTFRVYETNDPDAFVDANLQFV